MGLLDRAKRLAEQALQKADNALAQSRARTERTPGGGEITPHDARMGTAYESGMLGRAGWREHQLPDPAAVLPIEHRDRAGIPHSTKSEIVEEPFGMGRRWTDGELSVGLFYQLHPDHLDWQPPGGAVAFPAVSGASRAALPDGRSLVLLSGEGVRVVLEVAGFDEYTTENLARVVADKLSPR